MAASLNPYSTVDGKDGAPAVFVTHAGRLGRDVLLQPRKPGACVGCCMLFRILVI